MRWLKVKVTTRSEAQVEALTPSPTTNIPLRVSQECEIFSKIDSSEHEGEAIESVGKANWPLRALTRVRLISDTNTA